MKRLWFGVVLLILLTGLGLLTTFYAQKTQSAIADTLREARQEAAADRWQAADAYFQQAWALWQKHHHLTAAIVDHEPMEEVECLFRQLSVCLQNRDSGAFRSGCAGLEVLARAIGESHSISWWSIL